MLHVSRSMHFPRRPFLTSHPLAGPDDTELAVVCRESRPRVAILPSFYWILSRHIYARCYPPGLGMRRRVKPGSVTPMQIYALYLLRGVFFLGLYTKYVCTYVRSMYAWMTAFLFLALSSWRVRILAERMTIRSGSGGWLAVCMPPCEPFSTRPRCAREG